MILWDDVAADERSKYTTAVLSLKLKLPKNMFITCSSIMHRRCLCTKVRRNRSSEKEVDYFIDCLNKNVEPFNNGQAGLMVVKLLEAANRSIAQKRGKW